MAKLWAVKNGQYTVLRSFSRETSISWHLLVLTSPWRWYVLPFPYETSLTLVGVYTKLAKYMTPDDFAMSMRCV